MKKLSISLVMAIVVMLALAMFTGCKTPTTERLELSNECMGDIKSKQTSKGVIHTYITQGNIEQHLSDNTSNTIPVKQELNMYSEDLIINVFNVSTFDGLENIDTRVYYEFVSQTHLGNDLIKIDSAATVNISSRGFSQPCRFIYQAVIFHSDGKTISLPNRRLEIKSIEIRSVDGLDPDIVEGKSYARRSMKLLVKLLSDAGEETRNVELILHMEVEDPIIESNVYDIRYEFLETSENAVKYNLHFKVYQKHMSGGENTLNITVPNIEAKIKTSWVGAIRIDEKNIVKQNVELKVDHMYTVWDSPSTYVILNDVASQHITTYNVCTEYVDMEYRKVIYRDDYKEYAFDPRFQLETLEDRFTLESTGETTEVEGVMLERYKFTHYVSTDIGSKKITGYNWRYVSVEL